MLHASICCRLSAVVLCMLLAACGGGSGGSAQAGTSGGAGQAGSIASGNNAESDTPDDAVDPDALPEDDGEASGGDEPVLNNDARFTRPQGIDIDASGNLYVADSGNHTVRKIAPDGTVTTLAGLAGASGSADGVGAAARFSALHDVAVDAAGNVFVIDNSTLRRIAPNGTVVTLAGVSGANGYVDAAGPAARFNHPWGVAVGTAGSLYVADTGNSVVRRVTSTGDVTTFAGTAGMRGTADGSATSATFLGPRGIAADASGNLYITDWFGPPAPNIPEGSTFIRRIAADGSVSTMAGTMGGENGPAQFSDYMAIAADAGGNVFVAAWRSIQRISASGTVSTVIGPDPQFSSLEGVTVDAAGNLYVADAGLNVIRRVTATGSVTTVAGVAGESGSNDTTAD